MMAAAALTSLVMTGYVFGINNNLFHLPIVDKLYDEPQFYDDKFIQSLHQFASGVWLLLEGSSSWFDTELLFLFLIYLSRCLSFAGFLACAAHFGIKRRKERVLFAAVLCSTYILGSSSFAGTGGIFTNFFSHSEIANGLFLIGLAVLMYRKAAMAISTVGLAFFINAFMGVWMAPVFFSVLLTQIAKGDLHWRQAAIRVSVGVFVSVLFSAPVISAIVSNPEFGKQINFDYIFYLENLYPNHFLFSSIPAKEKIMLLIITAIGLSAFLILGRLSYLFRIALIASCVVYSTGILVPYLTRSPVILNLHLLRESVFIHLLSALAVAVLITSWLLSGNWAKSIVALAIAIAISIPFRMAFGIIGALLIFLYLLFDKELKILKEFPSIRLGDTSLIIATGLWIMFAIAIKTHTNIVTNVEEKKWVSEWKQVGEWARKNTAITASFLVPVKEPDNAVFQFISHRKVWVDWKRGAAVMWTPSYYAEWHRRFTEVSALDSHRKEVIYAGRNGLDYVVEVCPTNNETDVVFATERLCVYRAIAGASKQDHATETQ